MSEMKIFTCEQIKEIDSNTIRYEPVSSIDLMERAAGQLFTWYTSMFGRSRKAVIFAGPGNNGGDGLAMARMLALNRYNVEIHFTAFSDKVSADWEKNRFRLESETDVRLNYIRSEEQFPVLTSDDIIIDAIFGSGLSRSPEDLAASVIRNINKSECLKVAVDMPSGLFGEDNGNNIPDNIVRADYTLCFEFPRLSFMFAENYPFTGEWILLPIGLHPDAVRKLPSPYSLVEKQDALSKLRRRSRFDHKGKYGHGFLISGSAGKTGACILGAGAALRSGIGLLTCHLPSGGAVPMHSSVPEAMVIPDPSAGFISEAFSTERFTAVAAGPGLGMEPETQKAFLKLLRECKKPMVIDADALNILSANREWLSLLQAGSILTPHPGEFERLAGKTSGGFRRLARQIEFSRELNCTIILKGAYTSISTADGRVFFNSTGNPGMATAGSGDVLTGILLSLLAQGLKAEDAAVLGVFLHGLAGDIAAGESCYESIIASDIINCLGKAFNSIRAS